MNKFQFDFNAASRKAKFELPEVANVTFSVEDVVTGKKTGRKFAILVIEGKRFMIEDGDLNEAQGWLDVTDKKDREQGLLSILDGAKVSIAGGAIAFSLN